MRDERTNSRVPTRAGRTHKHCPACGQAKPLAAFYITRSGGLSGYCKDCQRAVSRRSRKRRTAALRALMALHPEAWRDALHASRDDDYNGDVQKSGGGSDAA
jgi:hypothetical protein